MAERTHVDRVAPVRAGAAETAPTSPHATPSTDARAIDASGPARFWQKKRVRRALLASFALSIGAHYALSPWTMFPEHGVEFRDTEGELAIPVDIFEDPPPPPPPPPPPAPPAAPAVKPGLDETSKLDASAPRPRDAGPRDAARDVDLDASPDAPHWERDGAADAEPLEHDGAVPLAVAVDDAGFALDAEVAMADAGLVAGDPKVIMGAAAAVQSGPPLVQVLVDMSIVRTNPIGAKMGPLFSGIPQWDEFMAGTGIDPVRDVDWIWVVGPSLINTSRDAVIVHYNITDQHADSVMDVLTKKYEAGRRIESGVKGVRCVTMHADRAERALCRPRSKLITMVPPDYAKQAVAVLSKGAAPAHPRPGEAARVVIRNPNHPMPFIPASITEARLWVVPRTDGGADVYLEGDTADADSAQAAARAVHRFVQEENSIGVRIVTRGLLNSLAFTSEGPLVKGHLLATEDQIAAIYDLVGAFLGVQAPPAASATPQPLRR